MSATPRPIADDYRYFIADLSRELPNWSLEAKDLQLTPDELALVIRHYGAGNFISEALGEKRGRSEEDTFDILAMRATMKDINQAWLSCGLAVMAGIMDYATRLVLRDVEALRDRESTPRYTDHASIG